MKLPGWWPWPAAPIDEKRWVVLDVETTGLDPHRDQLLAVSAIALHRDGARLRLVAADSFDTLVSPARPEAGAPDRANILVHGIGIGRRRGGRPAGEALAAFADWAGAAPRIGWHVAFDQAVLERAARHALGRSPRAAWIDLAPLVRAVEPGLDAHDLDTWLERYAIPNAQRHEAAADTLATAELLLRLWPRLRERGIGDARTMRRLAREARWALGARG